MNHKAIRFGPMAPPLADQLERLGYPVPPDMDHVQRDADAITRLYVRGVLNASAARGARNKLMRELAKAVHDARQEGRT